MPNRLYAMDPGSSRSALVALVWENGATLPYVAMAEKWENYEALAFLRGHEDDGSVLVVERVESMGMAVGAEVFDTCVWSGRFIEAWKGQWDFVTRRQVKLNLCGSMRAKDSNIRAALIDRWGPGSEKRATKKHPEAGPLAELAADTWSATAIGMTWRDHRLAERKRA